MTSLQVVYIDWFQSELVSLVRGAAADVAQSFVAALCRHTPPALRELVRRRMALNPLYHGKCFVIWHSAPADNSQC